MSTNRGVAKYGRKKNWRVWLSCAWLHSGTKRGPIPFFHRSAMQMAVSIYKICHHGNVTSLFSSLSTVTITSFYTVCRYDCNVILLYCVTFVAVYLAIIPVCHVFGIMLAFFALLGVHMGIIDTVANSILIKIHGKKVRVFYGAYSLTWPASMQIYGNKRNVLHLKGVQPPQDLFGIPIWPPFHCFGKPIWPPWRHVNTLNM